MLWPNCSKYNSTGATSRVGFHICTSQFVTLSSYISSLKSTQSAQWQKVALEFCLFSVAWGGGFTRSSQCFLTFQLPTETKFDKFLTNPWKLEFRYISFYNKTFSLSLLLWTELNQCPNEFVFRHGRPWKESIFCTIWINQRPKVKPRSSSFRKENCLASSYLPI